MEFKAQRKASVYNINTLLGINDSIDIGMETTRVYVDFTAEIDERSMGIDGITASVKSVIGEMEWYVLPDELTEQDKAEIIAAGGVEMRNGNWEGKFTIDNRFTINDDEFNMTEGGYLYVSDVEIDCASMIITVS